MWNWLRKILGNKVSPDLDELDADIEDIYLQLEAIQAKQSSFELEIWDYISGILEPLNKRVSQRIRRSEQKELNSEEPIQKKGGIIKNWHEFVKQRQENNRNN